ncbi:MAG: hypothetical protein ACI9OJ_004333 [Myxococcota bacterium]
MPLPTFNHEPAATCFTVKLPDVYTAELDDTAANELFSDLRAGATISSVQLRVVARGTPEQCNLDAGATALREGAATAMQIRYGFDGSNWCDTVTRRGGTFRIVRMRELRPDEIESGDLADQ